MMRRVEVRELAGCRGGVVRGQMREAIPLVLWPDRGRPAAEEGSLRAGVGDAAGPGAARIARSLGGTTSVGLGLGAVQHRLRQGQLVALALGKGRCQIRFDGDRFLAPALQQRLIGPVGVLLHEVGDLGRSRAARRQQPVVVDELGGDRIRVIRCRELRIRPPIGTDRSDRIGRLRRGGRGGEYREQSETGTNRQRHGAF